jgi:hypothetical protein
LRKGEEKETREQQFKLSSKRIKRRKDQVEIELELKDRRERRPQSS